MYLLGTDEAGYGPNLGPLVVVGTLWRVHDADPASEMSGVPSVLRQQNLAMRNRSAKDTTTSAPTPGGPVGRPDHNEERPDYNNEASQTNAALPGFAGAKHRAPESLSINPVVARSPDLATPRPKVSRTQSQASGPVRRPDHNQVGRPDHNEINLDLYERLSSGVTNDPADESRLAIADSKQLYSSGASLALLERGVLAALALLKRNVANWQAIWEAVCPDHSCDLPWHRTFDCALPGACEADALETGAAMLASAMQSGRIELVDLRATILHPRDFNERCDRLSSKGAVLSSATLSLARGLIRDRLDAPVTIVCDKHGGRNHYAGLVWEELAADEVGEASGFPVQTICEGREESIYRWRCGDSQREIRFMPKGERFLPAALASMTAKYLRELSMRAFNHFWAQRVPNLRPTAGYPGDALRFWNDIEPMVRLARFEERALWRVK